MTSTKLTLVAVGLAALLLVAGSAAAIPSQAADQAQAQNGAGDHPAEGVQHAGDDDDEADDGEPANEKDHETDDDPAPDQDHERDRNRTQTEDRRTANGSDHDAGPPVEMPSQVPDHVTRIHETIRSYLAGDLDGSLGQAIAGFIPAEEGQGNGASAAGPPADTGR